MSENEILIKIDQFDGPLALLLHLIHKEEILIKDLDLTEITQQYLDYLSRMQNLNFDIAGEYLLMAATLLHLKSQNAVLDEQDQNTIQFMNGEDGIEITTRGELIRRLEELERYQKLGEKLWALPKKGHEIFVKPKVDRKAIENSILTPIDLQLLTQTMIDLLKRENRKFTVLRRDRISIKEKLLRLKESLSVGQTVEFTSLLEQTQTDVIDKVITFISLLELARLKKLHIYQNDSNSPIYIEVKESLESFNVDTADGFEPEGSTDKVAPTDIKTAEVATTTLQ
jgi:segregation and condensation protein A